MGEQVGFTRRDIADAVEGHLSEATGALRDALDTLARYGRIAGDVVDAHQLRQALLILREQHERVLRERRRGGTL